MALSSALWCTDAQRSSQNKEASREAICSERPRQLDFDGRCSAMRGYVRSLGWEADYSHLEPAWDQESARISSAVFRSKIARDACVSHARSVGMWIWNLRA
eukprot:8748022-Alexandrium_andersonii.AAC.1